MFFGKKRKPVEQEPVQQMPEPIKRRYIYNLLEYDGTVVRHFSVDAVSDSEAEDLALNYAALQNAGYSYQYLAWYEL